MRIIGGIKGGRRLRASFNKGLRPTRDMVKEAVFNMLQHELEGSSFLDIFAGVGSIGIEALSRGAKEVYFVEKGRTTVKMLKENINSLELNENAVILNMDFQRAIRTLKVRKKKFDIIYVDPPYSSDFADKTLDLLSSSNVLSSRGIIMIEHFHKKKSKQRRRTIKAR